MNSQQIRQCYLDFFAERGHAVVASSALIPDNDPTLLFTNAGMNQFKDVFLGTGKRDYARATSSQKCLRAGGKHNDLENVGYTARHHTFFEMLGNFSFGDYFKTEAIHYAWELLTQVFRIPADKLTVTVYAEDEEAYQIWTQHIGLPAVRVIRIGDNKGARYASDNFWMMGDTGPCGPCTEIFYDHGAHIPGGPPGSPDEEGDRFVEIWNNVFMQFNRDEQGVMHPLPKPSVDTGMGLERIAAVLQGVHSNYDTDLFQPLIQAAAQITGSSNLASPSLRVLADHIRACAFLIADGVIPGNEGRAYVLRRIIRRAIRHGYKLGARQAFFHTLVDTLAEQMATAYPELARQHQTIRRVLLQEESRFFETIEHGMGIVETELKLLGKGMHFNGEVAFKLHDTFGFPLDLTADICREHEVQVDTGAFDTAMARQQQQARATGKFRMSSKLGYQGVPTQFLGYQQLQSQATIMALYLNGNAVSQLSAGESGVVVLDQTPFYAESGGQVGDRGVLSQTQSRFEVVDTQKIQADVFAHQGTVVQGVLRQGDAVTAMVDADARQATMRHHSATHLMHKALRQVLGEHVTQKGSLVDAEKTRFDFTHHAPLSPQELYCVENLVNAEILENSAVQAQVMSLDAAKATGAMMLFGEKYGETVRVLNIGSSAELCGGTHVNRTGDIGLFKIVAESGVAAGIRRVEAVTGIAALRYVQQQLGVLEEAAQQIKAPSQELPHKINQLNVSYRQLEKELQRLKSQLASSQGQELTTQAQRVGTAHVLATELPNADRAVLRETLDQLKHKLQSAVIVLASVDDDKVNLVAGVTADLTSRVKAGDMVNFVAVQIGGKGGGRADMAMAGGSNPANLAAALASVVPETQRLLQTSQDH